MMYSFEEAQEELMQEAFLSPDPDPNQTEGEAVPETSDGDDTTGGPRPFGNNDNAQS